ncbi:MAG: GlcNAc-PI de-N-acetylase [Thermoleophilaceae bacterium]|nr:GlcNAc-PI de-N-acetylase [Thermoleophilaceae bacterium]
MLVLHAAPHPDDELIGAPATLMALRDAGHEIVNVACSLGRPEEESTRRAELEEACRRARFELVVLDQLSELEGVVRRAELVVGPSPHDRHPFHETVGRALVAAAPERLWLWGLWGALPFPTTIVEYGEDRLTEVQHALGAHASQVSRNDYRRLVTGRGLASTVLGGELVFGFGSEGLGGPYAELTTEVVRVGDGWRLGAPRVLDPAEPFADPTGREVDGWLHSPSAVDA